MISRHLESDRPAWRGGPVQIVAEEASGPLLTSQRTLWQGQDLEENLGTTVDQLQGDYILPFYDSILTHNQDWLCVINPTGEDITFTILIAETPILRDQVLAPGASMQLTTPGIANGPVDIYAFDADVNQVPFLVSQRTLSPNQKDFNETLPQPIALP